MVAHDVEEVAEDVEVKGRREQASPLRPLPAGAGQQAGAQPRVEEIVDLGLIDELRALQDRLRRIRVVDNEDRLVSDPQLGELLACGRGFGVGDFILF